MPHAPPDTLAARRRLLRPTLPLPGGPLGSGLSPWLLCAVIVGPRGPVQAAASA